MKPLPHRYDVQLTGGPAGYATLSAPGLPELKSAPPLDYDGPGDAWSPAKASKIEFTTLELSSEGIVDRQEKVTRFTEIVLRPRLTIPQGTDRDRALWVLQKSEPTCLVSASLATPIRLEPELVTAP
jgi:hypothetical protein